MCYYLELIYLCGHRQIVVGKLCLKVCFMLDIDPTATPPPAWVTADLLEGMDVAEGCRARHPNVYPAMALNYCSEACHDRLDEAHHRGAGHTRSYSAPVPAVPWDGDGDSPVAGPRREPSASNRSQSNNNNPSAAADNTTPAQAPGSDQETLIPSLQALSVGGSAGHIHGPVTPPASRAGTPPAALGALAGGPNEAFYNARARPSAVRSELVAARRASSSTRRRRGGRPHLAHAPSAGALRYSGADGSGAASTPPTLVRCGRAGRARIYRVPAPRWDVEALAAAAAAAAPERRRQAPRAAMQRFALARAAASIQGDWMRDGEVFD
ncbi:hypothetical protein GGS23DRAFT_608486 [Durotheca rogersii]|uniref:uncharacterized protein n=1 Tax=Durotheca rogersii TaxID=419775 RepID=UPI00221E5FA2|nr:uncharacterized protein GGS23DRAFT_608486 [Durotheca rogersii]KAI5867919.1 hypothetical protein GGS23DRAFT_608486 [Durotheca rogersii]